MMMMMMMMMKVCVPAVMVCGFLVQSAEASTYDPKLCYMLDGFLGIYGLIITGMFIKEKFFRSKVRVSEEPGAEESGGERGERGRQVRRQADDPNYTELKQRSDREYKELPVKRERHKKKDRVYEDLSPATRDTYHTLQLQPLTR